jgi:hypothetical protein
MAWVDEILLRAPTLKIHGGQFECREAISGLCRFLRPREGLDVVLGDALSLRVKAAQRAHRRHVALRRRIAEPRRRLAGVLHAREVEKAERRHGPAIARRRRVFVPADRRLQSLRLAAGKGAGMMRIIETEHDHRPYVAALRPLFDLGELRGSYRERRCLHWRRRRRFRSRGDRRQRAACEQGQHEKKREKD